MLQVDSSISTKSGTAPAWEIASVVAMNVFGTVTTVSPGLIPAAIRAKRKASDHKVPAAAPQRDRHIFGSRQ
jgi:hypothetical protein